MTTQRRRPAPSQRRLSIQASSRRNQTIAAQNETVSQWRRAEIADEPQAPQARFSDTRHERDHWPEREERNERNDGRYDVDGRRPQSSRPHSRQPRGDQWQDHQWEERRWQANQQPEPHWQDRYDNRHYAYRDDERFSEPSWQEQGWYDDHRDRRLNGPSELDQDLKAMATVWSMMRQGAIRMLGEIGRQY